MARKYFSFDPTANEVRRSAVADFDSVESRPHNLCHSGTKIRLLRDRLTVT
jgi:hypothetical protein